MRRLVFSEISAAIDSLDRVECNDSIHYDVD